MAGPPGTAYRDVMRGFEKKYPEIVLEFQSFTPANFTARFPTSARRDNIFGIST